MAAEPMFVQWLYNALRDRAWRDLIEERLRQQELPVIELGNADNSRSQSDGGA